MPENKLVQCRKPFVTVLDGRRVRVAVGDLYDSNDPIVNGRDDMFSDLVVRSSRPAPVAARTTETATAAPAERRALSRQKPVETKPAAKPEEGNTNA